MNLNKLHRYITLGALAYAMFEFVGLIPYILVLLYMVTFKKEYKIKQFLFPVSFAIFTLITIVSMIKTCVNADIKDNNTIAHGIVRRFAEDTLCRHPVKLMLLNEIAANVHYFSPIWAKETKKMLKKCQFFNINVFTNCKKSGNILSV